MNESRWPRCFCGHGIDPHRHYRRGSDCSLCAEGLCRRYAPRDRPLPESHRLVAAISDAHAMANLAHLVQFGLSTRPPVQIPQQRRPPPRRQGGQIVDVTALKRRHTDGSPR